VPSNTIATWVADPLAGTVAKLSTVVYG